MGSSGVLQLQFLSRVFGEILDRYRPRSLAVPGCTTGNGFEHIDPRITRRVIGIDINPDYLALLQSRFGGRIPGLKLECSDIALCEQQPGSFDLIHCALVFEYVDPRIVISKAAEWLEPGGHLSVILQLASPGDENVTPTKFKSLRLLGTVMRVVPPDDLNRVAAEVGFSELESRVETLESGKQFHVGVYRYGVRPPGVAGRI